MIKKLYRSKKDKLVGGICGGIGETYEIDPVLVRIIWVAVAALTAFFPFVVVYIVAWMITPKHNG